MLERAVSRRSVLIDFERELGFDVQEAKGTRYRDVHIHVEFPVRRLRLGGRRVGRERV